MYKHCLRPDKQHRGCFRHIVFCGPDRDHKHVMSSAVSWLARSSGARSAWLSFSTKLCSSWPVKSIATFRSEADRRGCTGLWTGLDLELWRELEWAWRMGWDSGTLPRINNRTTAGKVERQGVVGEIHHEGLTWTKGVISRIHTVRMGHRVGSMSYVHML